MPQSIAVPRKPQIFVSSVLSYDNVVCGLVDAVLALAQLLKGFDEVGGFGLLNPFLEQF